jgi:hypothetical protein
MTEPQTPKKRGCLFYGCLTAVILTVVVAAGVYFAARYFMNQIARFTQATPMTLPMVEMAPEDLSKLRARVEAFKQTVADQKAVAPLVLTEQEINALIGSDPDFAELKGKVYVALPGDEVKGQVSIPLQTGPLKGRYLNGEATFQVSLANGVLFVMVKSMQVGNDPLPEAFMQGFRQQNLAQGVNADPQKAAALSKLETIEVKDGKLTIKGKAAP